MEAAKNFIRPYLEQGDTRSLHPNLNPHVETDNYSVRMFNSDIVVVTKLYGVAMNEKFSLTSIMLELFMESREKMNKRTPEECYAEIEKEIERLLKIFTAKLKEHKKQFLKDRKNWGYVSDLRDWADGLQQIA